MARTPCLWDLADACTCDSCTRRKEQEAEVRAERYCLACMERLHDADLREHQDNCPRCGIELDWTDGIIDGVEFRKRADEDDRKWREWLALNPVREVSHV